MSLTDGALVAYERRLSELRADARALDARSRRYSTLRAVTFLSALAAFAYVAFGAGSTLSIALGSVFGAAFLALVVAHALVVTRIVAVERRVGLLERYGKRAAGDFAGSPARGERFKVPDHPYAGDLDVFGQASLFQLLDAAETPEGEATLAAWLSAPAPIDVIEARQEGARELAGLPAFREDLAFEGAQAGVRGESGGALVTWAEAPPALGGASTPIAIARVLVPLTLLALAASQLLARSEWPILSRAWIPLLAAQALLAAALRRSIEPVISAASSREAPFGRYRGVLARIEDQPVASPLLTRLSEALLGEGSRASVEMRRLERIVGFAELRHNGLVHVVVNVALLYDLWCALALERWRARAGKRVRAWMSALGEIEALASFGAFAHENPGHAWPRVREGAPCFEATGLSHPLLAASRRVGNDVALGGPVPALLVTGSNMSGKSTMLRSIGVNAVLALAGAPVCASSLVMSPLVVRTSMRIDDSLERGVSHFYAELERLKRVVDSVDRNERVLFLLDEILHGTNSRERQIGAKAVILHLVARGAIGATSSHDLGLSSLEEESGGRVANVHFEELVADGKMCFDYRLKRGVVTTANALRLMKLVGIAVDLPEA